MPGIVGLITRKPRPQAEAELARMLQSIRHESFYETGSWIDESAGVYVAWTVRKNSFCDPTPVSNETGDLTLIFSGEEFPERGTPEALKQRGHDVGKGGSYLVHLAEEQPCFPASLNGRFHGLLIDSKVGSAKLFNDRYEMHRLYYHEAKDCVYFAAEAKAILAVRPDLRVANAKSLGELVACGCVLEDRTLFRDIHALPSASVWEFRNGKLESRNTYFNPCEWERQEPLDSEMYYKELREALSRNLPRYFCGDEPIGISLTGGLDTRVILAWRKPAPNSLPSYTFGGTYRDSTDVRIARKLATLLRQPYHVITVGEEFLSRFPHYAERSIYMTEGSIDVYRAADLFVSEKARQIAPVKIVGTYGSEILRQGLMFKATDPRPGLFREDFLAHVRDAKTTYATIRQQHPVTFAAFRQSPWYHYGILMLEQTQLGVRSPYLDNDFVRTVYRMPKANGHDGDVRMRLIRDGTAALAKIPTDRGIDLNGDGALPSLRHAFGEFTFKAEYAYDYGMPQWLTRLDHAFSALHLERLFLGRHKLLHFRMWYRNQLANYVRQMLLDERTLSRPYLQRKNVEAIVNGHLSGKENYTTEIHRLLTLELIHRLFFDAL